MKSVTANLEGYLPKGIKISDYCIDSTMRIEKWINKLPLCILGYKTPEELHEMYKL